MRTTLEVTARFYSLINVTAFTSVISGGVYKDVRPADSVLEDIVINCLPITGDQFQQATVNVNIYVPDISVQIGGVAQKMPDHKRLNTLAALAAAQLERYSGTEEIFKIAWQSLVKEPVTNQHYINLRIDYKHANN